LLITTVYVSAQTRAESIDTESLRGLKGVRLIIMFGRAGAMEEALRPDVLKVLQSDAKAKFQKAGIALLEFAQEVENAPGSPQLIVKITMDKPNGYVYPVVTETKLLQKARLSSNPSLELSVPTWETHGIGVYEVTNMKMLRQQVGSHIDQFIKAYQIVNP
jgi:hypothetical protein